MSYERLFQSEISTAEMKAWRSSGKKVLGIICCHIPLEIFHAADIIPVRLRATNCVDYSLAETWMSSFSCSFAKGILQYIMQGVYELDGLIGSDGCAMATRLYDNYKHLNKKENWGKTVSFLNVPRISNDLSFDFFRDELKILIADLEEFTGNKITDEKLENSIKLYNEARSLTREMYELRKAENPVLTGEEALKVTLAFTDVPVEDYIVMMREYVSDLKKRTPLTGYRARFVLIGSAVDDPNYLRVIESKGGLIVGDMQCYGSRCFDSNCPEGEHDPLFALAQYHLERLVCPRMVDSRVELHHEIIKVAKDCNADGVIYQKMQNCEIWGAESFLLNGDFDAAHMPYIVLQREENLSNEGQLAIRAEAFIEMVEKET